MKKKYIYNYIIVTLLILLQYMWANTPAIGSIFSTSGFVQIISTDRDVPPSQAVNGRTIYSDDIIRTAKDSFCKIIYKDLIFPKIMFYIKYFSFYSFSL